MTAFITMLAPVLAVFLVGLGLKSLGVLKKADADSFLKLVFYVAQPALILVSVSKVDLRMGMIYLMVVPMLIMLATLSAAFFAGARLRLSKQSLGTFVIGSAIMNAGFTLPFILAFAGSEGVARLALFDVGNGLLTFTLVYYIACYFGESANGQKILWKKFVFAPPVWALVVALALNISHVAIPVYIGMFLQLLGNLTAPLIMLALGAYFNLKFSRMVPVTLAIGIRTGLGLVLGLLSVHLFHLGGLDKTVVLVVAAAPIGYNTLTFSSLEHLDEELAANMVSYSILLGFLVIPALLYFFS